MRTETKRRIAQVVVILIVVAWTGTAAWLWYQFRQQRAGISRSIAAMTPIEKEQVSYDLMAAMFNAAQTNWTMTVTITPRTNEIEKP